MANGSAKGSLKLDQDNKKPNKRAENGAVRDNVHFMYPGLFIKELEEDIKNAEPWSVEKAHYFNLVCQYINRPHTSPKEKRNAFELIVKYSDIAQALDYDHSMRRSIRLSDGQTLVVDGSGSNAKIECVNK